MINRGHNFVSFCHAVGRCATRRNRNGEAASVALAREFCGVRSKFLANRRQGPIQLKVCSTTQRRSSRVLLESTGRLPDLRVPEAKRGACGFSAFPKVPRPAWKQSKTRGGPPATEETMRGSIGPDYT